MNIDINPVILHLFRTMENKNVPTEKVVIQKIIYFLNTQGVRLGFKFEPYTYGPFSFDLANYLSSLAFWDQIKEHERYYTLTDRPETPDIDVGMKKKIDALLDAFCKVAGNNFDFQNMELLGTTLYCAESIIFAGEDPEKDQVVAEFIEWKKDKYSKERIFEAYNQLKPYIESMLPKVQ